MSVKIVQDKLAAYQCRSQQEEEHALKEITQELALYALYQADYFKRAAFQGGTCLRIVHGMPRFSEDLDFALLEPDPEFRLAPYLKAIETELGAYGYSLRIDDRADADTAVQTAFLKDDSLGRVLRIAYPQTNGPAKTLKIKLEVDTNPPAGATTESRRHDFPIDFPIVAHDRSSLFAGKTHALLCRPHIKGRDWYDFLWYLRQKITPNIPLLSRALDQSGPWKGQGIAVDANWLTAALETKVRRIDWQRARADVARFLRPADVKALEIWSQSFFVESVERLEKLLG